MTIEYTILLVVLSKLPPTAMLFSGGSTAPGPSQHLIEHTSAYSCAVLSGQESRFDTAPPADWKPGSKAVGNSDVGEPPKFP